MFDPKNAQFATNQIHGAHFDVRGVNPVSMPIYQTATFVFDSTEHGAACFRGEDDAFFYSRLHSPTSEECGARIALLEGVVLTDIPEGRYFLSAAPLNLAGADGAPCRAILIDLEEDI